MPQGQAVAENTDYSPSGIDKLQQKHEKSSSFFELTEIKMLSAKGSAKPDSQHYADSINNLQQKHEKIKQFFEKIYFLLGK